MKLPLSWLKDLVETDLNAEEISKKLLSCGFEVEEIIYRGKDIDKIVAGKIRQIEKHENADKLLVCKVDVGVKILQIVTGAKNVNIGDIVPVAIDGSTVFGGKQILKGELRGVLSEGMLCSGQELGITENDYEGAAVDGILILKNDVKPGSDMAEVLGLNEYVLDVSITANRPDCQSILGLAREVAAVTNSALKNINLSYKQDTSSDIYDYIDVQVLDNDLCPRYMAKAVKDIKIVQSPDWMKKRLRLCGLRPINAIVDITNYVLLEVGHPMHAFDSRQISDGKIVVRRAKQGETITTLNEQENTLDANMLVICDNKTPIAVAGVMGGKNSGIKSDTNTIIFESAKFARDSIRKTSRALNLRSDASSRFEKGIDSASCEVALNRALSLIDQLGCGTVVGGTIDRSFEVSKERKLSFDIRKIDSLLGIKIDRERILQILNNLSIKSVLDENKLICKVPAYREDIQNYPDIAEEIIRMYGYDQIKPTLLKKAAVTKGGKKENHRYIDKVKQLAESQGFYEIITYSFIPENAVVKLKMQNDKTKTNAVVIKNPLSEKMQVMRTTMVHSMLEVVALNAKHKVKSGKFFEFGNIYLAKKGQDTLPHEKEFVCYACYGQDEDFYTIKGAMENVLDAFGIEFSLIRSKRNHMHGGRSAEIMCGKNSIGYFGEIHPDVAANYDIKQRVYIAEIDFNLFTKNIDFYKGFKNISKFPEIERDLALIVDDKITCQNLIDQMFISGGNLLKDVELFDYYKGDQIEKGKKSLAFTLKFVDEKTTLKSEQIDKITEDILLDLRTNFDAILRV